VLAPNIVRPGTDLTLSVSIFSASYDVHVRGELKDSNNALLESNSITVASGDKHICHFFTFRNISFTVLVLMLQSLYRSAVHHP